VSPYAVDATVRMQYLVDAESRAEAERIGREFAEAGARPLSREIEVEVRER
jgi:hypothetical protein